MSLKHAILGLLRSQPMSGYELKTQHFDRGVAHFWTADQAQIYRTLDHLRGQGLVEEELVVQQDRPNKKVYRLTAEGEAELVRWLATRQEEPPLREPFLVQVFFGDALEKPQLLQVLRNKLEERRQVLAALKAIEVPEPAEPSLLVTLRGSTRDLGVAYEHVAIRWLEDLIRRVEGLPERAWRKSAPSGARQARRSRPDR
jgi:DNA-binding PadR family transcriptional regulator